METDKFNLKLKAVLGDSCKVAITKILYPWRNQFLLYNVFVKAEKNQVNLGYWKEAPNLGDSLSPVIVNYMLQKKGICADRTVSSTKHLYAVGSVLTAGIQDCTVWGSGVLNTKLAYRLKKRSFDVRALRGPLSRAVMLDYGYKAPAVYGDPSLLLPEIYQPQNVTKTEKIGLVIHKDYKMSQMPNSHSPGEEIVTLNICTNDYEQYVDRMVSLKKVISSSLHGIILAEAYGIPAILLKPQVDAFKYFDYYYGTGRLNFPVADSVEQAKDMEAPVVPDFHEMREQLKATFPYDLYE